MSSLREQYPPTVDAHPGAAADPDRRAAVHSRRQAEAESMAHDRSTRKRSATSGTVRDRRPADCKGATFGAITFGSVPPELASTESDFGLANELGGARPSRSTTRFCIGEVEARAHAAEGLEFINDGMFLVDGDGIVRL